MNEISLNKVSYSYNPKNPIFEELSLQVISNEMTFVLGENASGKSTLLKLILGAISPKSGKIDFFGSDKINKSHIGFVPQSLSIDTEMTIEDCLYFLGSLYKVEFKLIKDQIENLLVNFSLDGIRKKRIKKLSGGQKQLVNICAGLLKSPKILLLDEPFVGLDYGTKTHVISYIKSMNITTLCVTHDVELAEFYGDKIIYFKNGSSALNQSPQLIVKENPYISWEIRVRNESTLILKDFEQWNPVLNNNLLSLSCKFSPSIIEEVERYLKTIEENILSVKKQSENLTSSLIGLYGMSYIDKKQRSKKKRKKA